MYSLLNSTLFFLNIFNNSCLIGKKQGHSFEKLSLF